MQDVGVRQSGLTPPRSSMTSTTVLFTVGKCPISYLDRAQRDRAQIPASTSSECCSNTQHTLLPAGSGKRLRCDASPQLITKPTEQNSKVSRLLMCKGRADGTVRGMRPGLPWSPQRDLQCSGTQSPAAAQTPLLPTHRGGQNHNQLLKHPNAHTMGALQEEASSCSF